MNQYYDEASDQNLIQCDRCLQWVPGTIGDTFTSGVYVVTEGGYWAAFANPGEEIVCDSCMWADERYIKVYTPHIIDGICHHQTDPSLSQ